LVGNQIARRGYFGDEYIQKQHFKSSGFMPMKVYNRYHKKYRYLAKTTT